jgi:hypothetical protein
MTNSCLSRAPSCCKDVLSAARDARHWVPWRLASQRWCNSYYVDKSGCDWLVSPLMEGHEIASPAHGRHNVLHHGTVRVWPVWPRPRARIGTTGEILNMKVGRIFSNRRKGLPNMKKTLEAQHNEMQSSDFHDAKYRDSPTPCCHQSRTIRCGRGRQWLI